MYFPPPSRVALGLPLGCQPKGIVLLETDDCKPSWLTLLAYPQKAGGGDYTATRRAAYKPPPHGPLQGSYSGWFYWVDLLVFLLVLLVDLMMFWDWIACELITLFVIFFHVVIRTCT